MTTDAVILAPAYVADDYDVSDLLAMAGFHASDIACERGNALRRWQRGAWIRPFVVEPSGRPYSASEDADGFRVGSRVQNAVQAGFRGSVVELARRLGELDASGQPSGALEHAIREAVEDGWLLPVRAIRLTPAGRKLVRACPEAMAVVGQERAVRKAARTAARLTADEIQALERMQQPDPLLLLAEATHGAPVPRATDEAEGQVGLPPRTVPRHRGRAHALSGGRPGWPLPERLVSEAAK